MAFQKAKALQEAEKSVSQGKLSQAIRQYQEILNNDPADVSLLNTIGDLYIRDRNIGEGLKQFHKLAEAFVRDGFNVKAIAIYRKISKVDPNSVDTLLKLAELYQLQGLSREAREQYLQATEFFKKRKDFDSALNALRKLVHLDPENINFRNRLAAECEQAGKRPDAAAAHLESAEILLRRDDQVAAEAALRKAAELDPRNSKVQLMRARVAISRNEPEEAERIINASPELHSDPSAKKILLDSYLALRKIDEADRVVVEVFRANPADFEPVSSLSALLVEEGNLERAYELLSGVAESVVSQQKAGPLIEALRRIWAAAPNNIPTLELIHRICERTADEFTLPEVLEALGHAYEDSGELEKAEAAYTKLVEREPENETFHALLNAIQKKLGREIKPVDFSSKEMALVVEEPAPAKPAAPDATQEAMLKEAFENSDLFTRYNLTEKAIGELEKVLQVYPDQIDVHRRILEIARKGFPERAAAAAAHLARIHTEQGDHETASKYQAVASSKGVLHELPLPTAAAVKKAEEPPLPPAPAPAEPVATSTIEFPIAAIAPTAEESDVAPPTSPPAESSFDLTLPEVPSEPPAPPPVVPIVAEPSMELDLSGDLEDMAAFGLAAPSSTSAETAAPPPAELPPPVEFPFAVEEAVGAPVESPVVAEETPAAEVEPAIAAPEPVATVAEPPLIEEPVAASVELPVFPQEPTAVAAEAPVFQQEPAAVSEEPPVVPEEPATASAEPPAVAEEPAPVPVETPEVAETLAPALVEPPPVAEEPAPVPIEEKETAPAEIELELPEAAAPAQEEDIPVELEDSRIEVEFYLENGFLDEARQALVGLQEKYPNSSLVKELRRKLTGRTSGAPPAEPVVEIAAVDKPVAAEPERETVEEPAPVFAETPESPQPVEPAVAEVVPMEVVPPQPEAEAPPEPVPAVEEPAAEEWELPTSYAAAGEPPTAVVEQSAPTPVPVREPEHVATPPIEEFSAPPHGEEILIEESTAESNAGMDMLGDLAGELASSLEGMADSADAPPVLSASAPATTAPPAAATSHGAEQLSGLLAEMEGPGDAAAAAAKDDPETHYNLGVAFREMGLLDEAIGEFQKVVKGAGKGKFPSNFLQACSLLAICFMEKKMPAIAVKWYMRALETPGLDEEAAMALQYDLGLAYEQAGDSRNALERFTEVYSQNIDFRDVADKIRELQQKA